MGNKIVILFGAGASNGSGGLNLKPPLGNELYNELANEFPDTWGSLPSKYSTLFKKNFELGMEEWYSNADNIVPMLVDMTTFFGKYKINKFDQNLYFQLITKFSEELKSNKLVLSTINYDCLIEHAINHSGLGYDYWNHNKQIRLLKIHGSCNFFTKGLPGSINLKMNRYVQIKLPLEPIDPAKVIEHMKNSNVPAAMSIYAKGKDLNFGIEEITLLLSEFQNVLMSSSIVIIIGVKPNPDDYHIWDIIKESDAQLLYIGNEEEFQIWNDENRNKKESIWISNRFQKGFTDICKSIDNGLRQIQNTNSSISYSFDYSIN